MCNLRKLPWWTPLIVTSPTYFAPQFRDLAVGETVYLAHSNDHELRADEVEIMVQTPCYPDKYGAVAMAALEVK